MPIQLKRSAVAGKVPTTDQLSLGELAVNTRDGRLFLKKDNGSEDIIEFVSNEVLHGQVAYFASSTAPTGWLKCNGAAVSRATYADLYLAIGTAFGAGDGSTTFNLPDLRGEFARGWDDGRGVDNGRSFGSAQGQSIENLYAQIGESDNGLFAYLQANVPGYTVNRFKYNGDAGGSGSSSKGTLVKSFGSGETRPRNISLLACIKY